MIDLLACVITSSSVQLAHMTVSLFAANVSDKLCALLVFETGSITGVNAVIPILANANEELGTACATSALLLNLLPVAHPGVVLTVPAMV